MLRVIVWRGLGAAEELGLLPNSTEDTQLLRASVSLSVKCGL